MIPVITINPRIILYAVLILLGLHFTGIYPVGLVLTDILTVALGAIEAGVKWFADLLIPW